MAESKSGCGMGCVGIAGLGLLFLLMAPTFMAILTGRQQPAPGGGAVDVAPPPDNRKQPVRVVVDAFAILGRPEATAIEALGEPKTRSAITMPAKDMPGEFWHYDANAAGDVFRLQVVRGVVVQIAVDETGPGVRTDHPYYKYLGIGIMTGRRTFDGKRLQIHQFFDDNNRPVLETQGVIDNVDEGRWWRLSAKQVR